MYLIEVSQTNIADLCLIFFNNFLNSIPNIFNVPYLQIFLMFLASKFQAHQYYVLQIFKDSASSFIQ